jgi:hypothetical protein
MKMLSMRQVEQFIQEGKWLQESTTLLRKIILKELSEDLPQVDMPMDEKYKLKEEMRKTIQGLEDSYSNTLSNLSCFYCQQSILIHHARVLAAWLSAVLPALICIFVFPLFGAIAISGGLPEKIIVGVVFGLAMRFLFSERWIIMCVPMGDKFGANCFIFCFLSGLIVFPILVLGAFSLFGLVLFVNFLWLVAGIFLIIIMNLMLPSLCRDMVWTNS